MRKRLPKPFREEDPGREFVDIIRRNAQRMYRLTEDLLTLARVESGEQRFDFRAVPPGELLDEAALSFNDHYRNSGIELSVMNNAQGEVEVDRGVDPAGVHQPARQRGEVWRIGRQDPARFARG